MDKIKAVIFDFDNTLGDRFQYCYLTYRHFVKTFLPEIDEKGILFECMVQDLVNYDEFGTVEEKDYVIESFERKYKVSLHIENFTRWWVENQFKFTVLYPDTVETVKKLKEKFKIGVLTNGYHIAQWGKLEKSGLMPYIDEIVVSEDAGVTKPDVRIFQMMADRLHLDVSECMYVGDTFSADILGAYNSGMLPVWIWPDETTKPSQFPVLRIRKLSDLLEMLDV